MELFLTDQEINIIKGWADSNIHGGHWGDGDLMVPEEEILLRKLNTIKEGRLHITDREAKLILTWSESSHGIHIMEEDSIVQKIKMLIKKKLEMYNERFDRAD